MVKETVCLQCGDRGLEDALVHCIRCLDFAVHRYCLDVLPETFDEIVHWLCDDCNVKVHKQAGVLKHDVILSKMRHDEVSENGLLLVEATEHVCKDVSGEAHDICTKLDLVGGHPVNHDMPVQLTENIGVNLIEPIESITDWVKHRKRKKMKSTIIESATEKDQYRLATTSHNEHAKVDISKRTRLESEPIELLAGCPEQEKTEIKNKRNRKRRRKKRTIMKLATDNDQLATGSHNEHVKVDINKCKRPVSGLIELSTDCLEQKKTEIWKRRKKKKIMGPPREKDQDKLDATSYNEHVKEDMDQCTRSGNEPIELSKKNECERSEQKDQIGDDQPLENSYIHLGNEIVDLSSEERDADSGNNHNENRVPEDKEESTSTFQSTNASIYYPEDLGVYVAEPVIVPIWRGSFDISNKEYDNIDDLVAHISNKACDKVYRAAYQFKQVLHLEMFPKSNIWPKSFVTTEPSGDNIALYFFPSKISERAFEKLVEEMMHKELAFKAYLQNAELLIFTSTELPLRYWRFRNKYYLWGVFREPKTSLLNSLSSNGATEISLMRENDNRSPISPMNSVSLVNLQ